VPQNRGTKLAQNACRLAHNLIFILQV
jgi:hypothetical protein